MARFNAPYGTPDQHITSPAQNFGYRHLVAYLVDGGVYAKQIIEACAEAQEDGAPKDAIYKSPEGRWKGRSQLVNMWVGRRLDSYAAALLKYETDRAQEQKNAR